MSDNKKTTQVGGNGAYRPMSFLMGLEKPTYENLRGSVISRDTQQRLLEEGKEREEAVRQKLLRKSAQSFAERSGSDAFSAWAQPINKFVSAPATTSSLGLEPPAPVTRTHLGVGFRLPIPLRA